MTGSCHRNKNEQWKQSQHLEGKIRQGKIVHVGSEDRIDSECISQGVKLEDEKPSMNQRTTWPLTLKGPPDLSTSNEDVRSGSSLHVQGEPNRLSEPNSPIITSLS